MFLQGVNMPFCKSETFLSSSWKRPRARRMSHPLIWAQATLKCHCYSNTWHYLMFYGAGLFLPHSPISRTLLFSSKEMVPCCKSGFPSPSKKHWQFLKHPLNSMTTRLKDIMDIWFTFYEQKHECRSPVNSAFFEEIRKF